MKKLVLAILLSGCSHTHVLSEWLPRDPMAENLIRRCESCDYHEHMGGCIRTRHADYSVCSSNGCPNNGN